MKKIFIVLLSAVAALGCALALTACSKDNEPETDKLLFTKIDGGYEFSGIEDLTKTELVIPSTYKGEPVISIGDNALSGRSKLLKITVPDGIISIGENAFAGCSGISEITIPESVTYIGDYAFSGCNWLTDITIPNGVTSIGESIIRGCGNLAGITVERGNTVYHSNGNCLIETASKTLISGCQNSVIPDDGSVTSIGYGAFVGSDWLMEIKIPYGVTTIGANAFRGCFQLTEIEFPNSITSIGWSAFAWCGGLTGITIPESVTEIGDLAFNGCSGLESIAVSTGNEIYQSSGNCLIETESKTLVLGCQNSVIPNDGSVTSIGWSAFGNCSELTSIIIPDGVTLIDEWAFAGCTNLTGITIPNSVTIIGEWAFSTCINLSDVYYKGSEQDWTNISIYDSNTRLTNATIHYNYNG